MIDRRLAGGANAALMFLAALGASCAQLAAVDGSASGYGITFANGFLDESRVSTVALEGALQNCFLQTIRVEGVDTCIILEFPSMCMRVRNNIPGNLLEASSKRNHYSIFTAGTKIYLGSAAPLSAPTNKKVGIDDGHGTSGGSSRGMSRTISNPISVEAVFALAQGISLGILCKPSMPFLGSYIFYAEGDETDWGASLWRSIVSPYYTNFSTSGLSLLATSVETVGACPLDLNYVICFGGWGAKYPTSGTMPAKSPALTAMTTLWRAQEIHAAAAGTYGFYDTSLGFAIHSQFHDPRAMIMGSNANLAPYSPGSYVQWLYPGIPGSAVGQPQDNCGILGVAPGTNPQVATQILGETINKTWIEDNTIAFYYWPRFVCCTWCKASNDSGARHMMPEQSFTETLTRKP